LLYGKESYTQNVRGTEFVKQDKMFDQE